MGQCSQQCGSGTDKVPLTLFTPAHEVALMPTFLMQISATLGLYSKDGQAVPLHGEHLHKQIEHDLRSSRSPYSV